MKGRVKWWNPGEGYGFIEYDNNRDIFVHFDKNVIDESHIKENQEIEFTIEEINNSTFIKELVFIEQTWHKLSFFNRLDVDMTNNNC